MELGAVQLVLAAVGAENVPPTSDVHRYESVSPGSMSAAVTSRADVALWSMRAGVAVMADMVGALLSVCSVHSSPLGSQFYDDELLPIPCHACGGDKV